MFPVTKKHIILLVSIAVIIAVGFLVSFLQDSSLEADFIVVERGDLIQEVSVTGKVKPSQSVDLAFEKIGKISWINAEIGKHVVRGEALAGLESSDVDAKLESAKALQRKEEAQLGELLAGTRPEELRIQEVKVLNTEKELQDEEVSTIDVVRDAYTKSDDAIRNKTDQFITNPQGADPVVNFPIGDVQLRINIELGRVTAEELLFSWNILLSTLTSESDPHLFIEDSKAYLLSMKSFLEDVALAVNALKASSDFSQATIDSYRSDIATARSNINTATSNLSAAEESLRDAESALLLAEEELVLKHAGAREEQVTAQQAKVEEARASVNNYKAEIGKTILFSPFSGVITKKEAEVGEIVAANSAIISLISADRLLIETNIPEADIAKLSVNDVAFVTLDAYSDDALFQAQVVSIEPAETIIEGVSTYKTKLQFTERDERIRSGMTANIDISTDKKMDVIAVPQRAVITKNGDKIVRILVDGIVEEVLVATGLRGSDGRVEILKGISEGDKVIIFLEE
ncbi:hypothetical protein CL630_03935 [bacterium]|nr:hypothetical protein [bacterium]|tara:strand:- start:68256 stop:69806 length:1551 start_codon:yes stop_codon:yes gene_type:complete